MNQAACSIHESLVKNRYTKDVNSNQFSYNKHTMPVPETLIGCKCENVGPVNLKLVTSNQEKGF